MLTKFQLKKPCSEWGEVVGYHWPCETPRHVMCLIHGIGEYAGRYDRMAGYLNEAGIAVIGMDLRGHGESFGKRGHCAPRTEVLSDIDVLLEYAQSQYSDVPIVLYGHSMGGNIVLDYRKRGRLNSLPQAYIVSAPWIRLVKPIKGSLYKAVKILARVKPSFAINSKVSADDLGNKKSVGEYEWDPLVHNKITALCALEGFEIGKALEDGTHHGNKGAEGKPLLLMHGAEDRLCNSEGTKRVAALEDANCEFIEWPKLYHEIHNGGKESSGEEVILKIADWINAL